jgi:hypothetical protein
MAHELERAATSLVSSGQHAAAEAVFSEALAFAPNAANLLGVCACLRVCVSAGCTRLVCALSFGAHTLTRGVHVWSDECAPAAARSAARARSGRVADALADAKAAVQAAPSWPRGHAVLALALQARGSSGAACDAMEKAAWLARVSDGDAAAAAQYTQLAAELRQRKAVLIFDDDGGALFGEATPTEFAEEEAERAAAAAAAAAARARGGMMGRTPGVTASGAAGLEARLRALEASSPRRGRPEGGSAGSSAGSDGSDAGGGGGGAGSRSASPPPRAWNNPPSPRAAALSRGGSMGDAASGGALLPRVLAPGGWQPPPQGGGPARHHA